MFKTIEEYLDALKIALKDADPALVQDALSDAREHLSMALETAREKTPEAGLPDLLNVIVEHYGSPDETASAYREVERRTPPILKQAVKPRSLPGRFFGVYIDPRTWSALLFMLITFVTGIVYFTWTITGLSLSLSLLILIIGVPFAILFLLSIQGLALLEGRLVEALLGVRMPRRPTFAQPGLTWTGRLKALITDKHTWISMLYMILQLVLGVVYFTLDVTILSVSLSFIAAPIAKLFFNSPNIHLDLGPLPTAAWVWYLLPIVGVLILTLTMHLVRGIGWLHGRYAKWMLVS